MVEQPHGTPEPTDGGSRPVPDPTSLTTEQLLRAVASEHTFTTGEIKFLQERLRGISELTAQQFVLIERQRVEQKQDTKAAVDAALSAAKEAVKEQTSASEKAVAKTEASFMEQLKAQNATAASGLQGLSTVVADLKERVVQIESVKVGGQEQTLTTRDTQRFSVAIVGLIITIVLAAVTIAGVVAANSP